MIRSMTGYGGAKGDCAGLTLRVEIRSVNNRYLDCAVRLPRNLLFAEDAVKTTVQEHVSRGKADVFVTLEGTASDDVTVKINEALAREYAAAIGTLGETLGLECELNALALSRLPDVTTLEKRDLDAEAVSAAIAELTERALAEFDAMRAREGQKLAEDIAARLDTVETLVSAVEQRSPETVTAYRERLYQKMREVLDGAAVDEQRILLEAAIFAVKVAVDEETVRLRSHVAQMRSFLETGSPIGRKMDFLVQEFNREANTIGSKCSDGEITRTVIELKSEIEKIREQVQNIE
ncbi:MAG: YicC family protein [Oscillospiraceae bacterium]|nr:YicC family protein [Oscillospiraceae bacterium]